jgi:hypothetical protein
MLELKLKSNTEVLKLIGQLMTQDPVNSGTETHDYSFQPLSLLILDDHTQQAIIVL